MFFLLPGGKFPPFDYVVSPFSKRPWETDFPLLRARRSTGILEYLWSPAFLLPTPRQKSVITRRGRRPRRSLWRRLKGETLTNQTTQKSAPEASTTPSYDRVLPGCREQKCRWPQLFRDSRGATCPQKGEICFPLIVLKRGKPHGQKGEISPLGGEKNTVIYNMFVLKCNASRT